MHACMYMCVCVCVCMCACISVCIAAVLSSAGKSPLLLEPQGDGRQTTSALQSEGKLFSYYVPVLELDFTVLLYTQPRPQH